MERLDGYEQAIKAQEQADRIAALTFKFCLPADDTSRNPRRDYFNFTILAINYAQLVHAYCKQRDDKPLKRVSYNEFQGANEDPNDIPRTEDQILERMNDPFFDYHDPIQDPHIAYFDYILEKQIDMLIDQIKILRTHVETADEKLLSGEDKDGLIDRIVQAQVYREQYEDISQGLVASVNDGPKTRAMSTERERGMADLARLLADFSENCASFPADQRPEATSIVMMLVHKPLLTLDRGFKLDADTRLN